MMNSSYHVAKAVVLTLGVLALLWPANGDEISSIRTEGEWSDVRLMNGDRVTIETVRLKGTRSIVLSIIQLQDRESEAMFSIDLKKPIKGATIRELGGGPTIGYAKGNFELINLIYVISFDADVEKIEIPKESFRNIPQAFKYALPYRLSLHR